MGVLSGFKDSIKGVAKQYAGELAGGLIDKLPTEARKLASGALKQYMNASTGKSSVVGADIRRTIIKTSGGQSNDWRCKLTWEQQPGSPIFDQLPSKNTIIWPYTPQLNINYAANYDSIKTLQTNYASQAYQSSEIQSLTIAGLFTATNIYEANYLYAVIHFLKSVTKGFNAESNGKTGSPPPILKLNYLGKGGGINNMPVVIQAFNMEYPTTVDYVRSDIGGGVGQSMVPSEVNIAVTLAPVYSRANMVAAEYSTTAFIQGKLLEKGYF